MQRFFDFFLSLIAIFMLLPVFIPIIFILKLTGEREVFYCQNRVGRFGRNFKIIKFATMFKNSPNIGTGSITVKNDPRVLPFGKFLRKTKINELPQLINVLRGDMSLIGPRPLTKNSYDGYSYEGKKIIYSNRPGISGIGSIVFRDEESLLENISDPLDYHKNVIGPFKEEIEVWYAQKKNINIYFLLIFLTIWVVLFPSSKFLNSVFKDLPKFKP